MEPKNLKCRKAKQRLPFGHYENVAKDSTRNLPIWTEVRTFETNIVTKAAVPNAE